MTSANDAAFLREAIALAVDSVATGGGPFGAVIVHGGRVVGRGQNRVVPHGDPTAHAEVVAVRAACEELGGHELTGATVYASCEPCPMCLGALYWARVDRVVFASGREDAAGAGFDDARIYDELPKRPADRSLPMEQQLTDEGAAAFRAWKALDERQPY